MTNDELNPKDAVGQAKPSFSVLPMPVIYEIVVALMEGARKYGRSNVRVIPVRSSIYFDATMRHLTAWWEGQDIDPDSGLHHVTKAIASLVVLRDAMLYGTAKDDRPPRPSQSWIDDIQKAATEVIERLPQAKEPFTEEGKSSVQKLKNRATRDAGVVKDDVQRVEMVPCRPTVSNKPQND